MEALYTVYLKFKESDIPNTRHYLIKWSYDLRSYERNFYNCVEKSEKLRTSTGFEPVTPRLRCDALTNWAMKPPTLGAGHLWAPIHLYHSAAILESVGNKGFVFALSLPVQPHIEWEVRRAKSLVWTLSDMGQWPREEWINDETVYEMNHMWTADMKSSEGMIFAVMNAIFTIA